MKKLLTLLFFALSITVVAQTKIRTGEILFTSTPTPADTVSTTSAGRLRYDPITGKYRFWNGVTNSWLTYGSGGGSITGSGTINQLTYWTGTSALGSLSTSTYPSLTELSYVKGLTSTAQTQLDSRWSLSSGGALTANNTISGAFNIGFTNNLIGLGVAPASITANTRLDVRGISGGNSLRIASDANAALLIIANTGATTFFNTVGISGSNNGVSVSGNVTSANQFLYSHTGGFNGTTGSFGSFVTQGTTNSAGGTGISFLSSQSITAAVNHTGFYHNPTNPGNISGTHLAFHSTSGRHLFGGTTITAGSVLADFQSTSLGLLVPRVTNIASIATPVNGMIAYDAATNLWNFRQGGSWINLGGLAGSTGSVDNAVLRANGSGGSTLQTSPLVIADNADITLGVSGTTAGSTRYIDAEGSASDVSVIMRAKGNGTAEIEGEFISMRGDGGIVMTGNDLAVINNDGSAGSSFRLFEGSLNGSNFIALNSPNSLVADFTYTLPTTEPSVTGQVLSSTTGGVMSWSTGLTYTSNTLTSPRLSAVQGTIGNPVITYSSTSTNDDPEVVITQQRSTESNGSGVTIWSESTITDYTYHVTATVLARRTGGSAGTNGDAASYIISGLFKNISGTVTQIGSTTNIQTVESQPAWTCVFQTVGGSVSIAGTGAANNDLVWHVVEAKVSKVKD